LRLLLALDVNGTTSWGLPPGQITPDILKSLKAEGHLIVGASGHIPESQVKEFADRGIELDACPAKNMESLRKVKEEFKADRYILIGDSPIDQEIAAGAGYEYMAPIQFLSFISGNPRGLNLGSGGNNLPGYTNVDNRPETNPDMVYDLEKTPYPWPDESAAEIIWKDALEHLSWRVIEFVLKECHRILEKGGRMYIQCPDLEAIARKVILDPDFKYGDLEGHRALGFWVFGRQDPQPDGTFGGWGGFHKSGFTIPALRRLLEETGFVVEDIHNDGGSNICCYARKL